MALYNTNRHACYLLQYHLVVVTKYRHKVITDDIEEDLIKIAKNIFEEKQNCKIINIKGNEDHIHILFEAMPQTQLSSLINNFKTVSSRLIRKKYAEFLKPYYWKPYFWSRSYFVCTVSEKSEEIVNNYIENQKKH